MGQQLRRQPIQSFGLSSQRGASLIVVLALVMGVMILAAMSVGGNVASERASANARDGDLAFQAAELALRTAELAASSLSGPSDGNASCSGTGGTLGICYLGANNYRFSASNSSTDDALTDDALTAGSYAGLSIAQAVHCPAAAGCPSRRASILDASPAVTVATGNSSLSRQPSYLIEVLPSIVAGEEAQSVTWMYRITAKGWGASASTQKVIQSVYYRSIP